jgi:hemerythrin-like metal-binding protein
MHNKVSLQRKYMTIIWDKVWSVGHAEIDQQHQDWIEIFNRLENTFMNGSSSNMEELKKEMLKELLEYTNYHFRTEEKVMNETDYPEAATHWRLHKDFKNLVNQKLMEFRGEGSVLGSQLLLLMKNWLVSHIITEDRKLVLFLESRGKAESCSRTD